MKALLIVLALCAATLAVAPTAAACPDTGCSYGSCWIAYTEVWIVDGEGNGYGFDVPRGIECAW